LRAVAALMIVAYHLMLFTRLYLQPWSQAINADWYILGTGVQLFFTLSGFLLFRPYIAAMLNGKPLPSARHFYWKRALRILPAYWVALAILLYFSWPIAKDPQWLNTLTHVLLIHDIFPRYNRDVDGPFWTLAVEAQFYLLMPWIAATVAWVIGHRRRGQGPRPLSTRRILVGLVSAIAAALLVRWLGATIMSALPANASDSNNTAVFFYWLGLTLIGMQGKFLEVFLVGAVAATLYVAATERRLLPRERLRSAAIAISLLGLAALVLCILFWQDGVVLYQPGASWGWDVLLYPLATGISYSSLLLGIVWGSPLIRGIFEFRALRFVGNISYSVYIWHLPIIHLPWPILLPATPFTILLRILLIFLVAYLSYQLVERPFLQRRRRAVTGIVAQAS
jgi:peptidoglycan/LPS O-acetylase OafA/YrhL